MAECEAYLSGVVMDYESKHNSKVSAIAIPIARGSCFERIEVL